MIELYQTDTPTPSPTPTVTGEPTWIWATPTLAPTVTPNGVFDPEDLSLPDMEAFLYTTTDQTVVVYNQNRDFMDMITGLVVAMLVIIMIYTIYKRVSTL